MIRNKNLIITGNNKNIAIVLCKRNPLPRLTVAMDTILEPTASVKIIVFFFYYIYIFQGLITCIKYCITKMWYVMSLTNLRTMLKMQ